MAYTLLSQMQADGEVIAPSWMRAANVISADRAHITQ